MTKSQIIELIYKDKAYINICRQICANGNYYDYQDLFHEVILILFEKQDHEITTAHEAKFLKFLFARICNNQYRSKTSPFHKKYRGMIKFYTSGENNQKDVENIEDKKQEITEVDFSLLIDKITSHLNTLNDYDKNLFAVWMELGMSSAEVARRTGIEQQNVSKKILKIRKELANNYGEDYFNIFN
jgi:RNA polymerase sigma factor (sigma-70 family)